MKKKSINASGSDESKKNVNVTNQKLAYLPFKSAKSLKEAQDQLRLQVWRRLEEAKILDELLSLEEFSFWHKEFEYGLVCEFTETNDSSLVRVSSHNHGITININKGLAVTTPLADTVLGSLVKAMSESFAKTYYGAKGLLPHSEHKENTHGEQN